ncbi:hypothetical protein ABVK25_008938 [Lepraria finkii]|uniref:Uncharacterized protein n=1 Tax=Lepraria finkii TaxID=1340010 RepID=A0ABR4B195_9LECA
MESLLGPDRKIMVNWRFLEQIRRSLRLHCFAGRRIGEHLLGDHEHARASRYYLCAIGVSYYVWDVGKFEGGEGRESWGAGTFAGGQGERQPLAPELELAQTHGSSFYKAVSKVSFA